MPSKSSFTKSASKTRRIVLGTAPTPATTEPTIEPVTVAPVEIAQPLNPRLHNVDPVTGFALPFELPTLAHNPPARVTSEPGPSVSDLPSPFAAIGEQIAALNIPSVQPAIVAASVPATPNTANDRALAKAAAAKAIAAFYSGRSLPFKAASELKRKSPINFALTRDATERSAALLATILTYCDVQPGTLTFIRGSGAIPGRLLGFTGSDAERIFHAGPESGGLSNCIPDRITYVSGPLAGPGAESAVFALNYNAVKSNLTAFNVKTASGEHLFSAALGLLDLLHNAQA